MDKYAGREVKDTDLFQLKNIKLKNVDKLSKMKKNRCYIHYKK